MPIGSNSILRSARIGGAALLALSLTVLRATAADPTYSGPSHVEPAPTGPSSPILLATDDGRIVAAAAPDQEILGALSAFVESDPAAPDAVAGVSVRSDTVGSVAIGSDAIGSDGALLAPSPAAAGDDQPLTTLPIPAHPERRPPRPENTLPKPAQSGRQEFHPHASPLRRSPDMPIAGRASRHVAGPGEVRAPDAEQESPGLFPRLPHRIGPGITIENVYTGGVFNNARGGLDTHGATRYLGNLDTVFNFDTERMGLWEGGQFFLYLQSLNGRSLSPHFVGDWQYYDNLEAFPRSTHFTQLSELWYYHTFDDGRLSFKLGKQDAGANFAFADLGGDFVNASFTLVPIVPLPTFPNPGLGLATFFKPNDRWTVSGGIFDGVLAGNSSALKHLGTDGSIGLAQLQYAPQWGPYRQLPGTFRAGAFYHTGNWTEITTDPNPRTFGHNHGFWATADQMLWKEAYGADDEQGLGLFGQFGWAPGNRNYLQENYTGGLVYRGLLPGRDHDTAGIGVTNGVFGKQAFATDGLKFETAVELFYRIRVSPHVSIQPDMQFIANPGGNGDDCLIVGSRLEIVL